MTYKDFYGSECFPLTALADNCGYDTLEAIDVVEKAIFLLQRKVDISCRGSNGDTVLHNLFRSDRLHSRVSKAQAKSNTGGIMWQYPLSFTAPKDLLMVFITAGADVYAINDGRHTPSDIALEYGRVEEWIEALILCGYNAVEVIADSDPCLQDSTREPQTSKLSFEDYCRQRSKKSRFKNTEMDKEQFEEAMEAIEADREEFMKNHGERYDEAIKAYNEIYGEEELEYDETEASEDEYGEFSQQAGDDPRDLELSDTDTLRPQRAEFSDHWTKFGLEDTNLEREEIAGVADHSGGMDINGNQEDDFPGMDLGFGNDLLSNYEDYGGDMIVDRPQENGFSAGMDMGFGNHWPSSNVGYGEAMVFDGAQENDFAGMDLSFGNDWLSNA
ncbi:hypothetical protein B0J14DRAFT_293095 [Halenospora varia]|nr:hypothetical protein B0J14DRAFT_293095 [Halenospora varia]